MRTVSLAKVAAQAELLRVRRRGRRTVHRAAYGAVAAVFAIAALAGAHVAIVLALTPRFQLLGAVLIVGGGDLVIAVVLGLLAARDAPDAIERQAHEIRQTALGQLGETLALTTVIAPALRLMGGRKTYGLALAALTAHYLGGRR
jgi:type IV secretory pathway VirB2 component (pilin)